MSDKFDVIDAFTAFYKGLMTQSEEKPHEMTARMSNDLISREKLLHTLEGWLKLNARVVPTKIGKAVYMMIEDYPAVPTDGDLVSRAWLLAEYDRQHEGPAGKARKLIEDAPAVPREMTAREFVRVLFGLTSEFNDERWDVFCRYQQATTPEEAVAIIEAWVQEHPEEVDDER